MGRYENLTEINMDAITVEKPIGAVEGKTGVEKKMNGSDRPRDN